MEKIIAVFILWILLTSLVVVKVQFRKEPDNALCKKLLKINSIILILSYCSFYFIKTVNIGYAIFWGLSLVAFFIGVILYFIERYPGKELIR